MTAIPSGLTDLTVVRGATNPKTGVWQEASRHVVAACPIAPGASVEQMAGPDGTASTTVADMVAYLPYGSDVRAQDRVLLGSYPLPGGGAGRDVYEVNGRPVDWGSPFTGRRAGTVVALNVRH
jgi:hypothetical protein